MAKVGRPPKYRTAAEIEDRIKAYFAECRGKILKDEDGEVVFDRHGRPVIVDAKPPTVTGLALALGFKSRQSMLEYQGKREFTDTITRAKSMCEEYAESRLFDRDGARGAEFSLRCNFKWRDKGGEDISEKLQDDPLSEALRKAVDNEK